MNSKHLNTLEFPKVLERLSSHASFSASKELALGLVPAVHLSDVTERQAETTEARRLLSIKPDVSTGGARDVRPLLHQAARRAALLPDELLEVRQTLIAGRDLKRAVTRLSDQVPRLADKADLIHECPGLVQEIARCISERGEILDSASPDLARIRRELETVHRRLMERLNKIVQSPQNGKYLQETFITQLQGRYVIPLRAEFKGRIRGIVHDQSASGATLFIEPLATVELNNRWRQLQLDEEEEVRRVLLGLTDLVDQDARRIALTVEMVAKLDLDLAKAKYAEQLQAVEPEWVAPDKKPGSPSAAQGSPHRSLKLLAARHPLLDPQTVVPIDLDLPPETFILVITGPNTGGKTVTLKTVGLLAVMAQAGLHIPAAEGSALPLFRGIYADIGDEQSIEQSLSTFSSHLTNIVGILDVCDRESLVVLDELGAGTDPVEGSALARSILEYLRERRVTTLVATHYSELKAYAQSTPGVANASVEFDAETLAPTYRLSVGLPGRSNAFAIAARLGLDRSVIQGAQDLVSPEALQTEAMLRDIQAQLDAASRERAGVEEARTRLEGRLKELNQRLASIDEERRDILNSARAEARQEIRAVRQELRRLREQWAAGLRTAQVPASDEEAPSPAELEEDSRATLSALETKTALEETPPPPQPKYRGPLRPGDPVWVQPYQAEGEVISSHRGEVEVQLGRFRASVKRNQVELQRRTGETESPQEEDELSTPQVQVPTVDSPGFELDLRGQTKDEALLHLERYLDDAYLAGLPWVRIIHGKGSGVLRAAVRDALKGHSLVVAAEVGRQGEGGDGVTVARLAVEG